MPLWAVSHAPSSISSGLRGGLTLAGCIAAITGLTLQTVAATSVLPSSVDLACSSIPHPRPHSHPQPLGAQVADVQKFVAKEQLGADAPILDKGLWAFSRHPNYAGMQSPPED